MDIRKDVENGKNRNGIFIDSPSGRIAQALEEAIPLLETFANALDWVDKWLKEEPKDWLDSEEFDQWTHDVHNGKKTWHELIQALRANYKKDV